MNGRADFLTGISMTNSQQVVMRSHVKICAVAENVIVTYGSKVKLLSYRHIAQ
jgi:hypothetical protein